MSTIKVLQNMIMRRTSTFALSIIVTTFFFERAFDMGTEYMFEQMNKGKLWKHIKHRYVEQ